MVLEYTFVASGYLYDTWFQSTQEDIECCFLDTQPLDPERLEMGRLGTVLLYNTEEERGRGSEKQWRAVYYRERPFEIRVSKLILPPYQAINIVAISTYTNRKSITSTLRH